METTWYCLKLNVYVILVFWVSYPDHQSQKLHLEIRFHIVARLHFTNIRRSNSFGIPGSVSSGYTSFKFIHFQLKFIMSSTLLFAGLPRAGTTQVLESDFQSLKLHDIGKQGVPFLFSCFRQLTIFSSRSKIVNVPTQSLGKFSIDCCSRLLHLALLLLKFLKYISFKQFVYWYLIFYISDSGHVDLNFRQVDFAATFRNGQVMLKVDLVISSDF